MEMYTWIEEELIYEPCTWGHACEGLHTVSVSENLRTVVQISQSINSSRISLRTCSFQEKNAKANHWKLS